LKNLLNKFDNGNSTQNKGIIAFINMIRPRVKLIAFHSTTVIKKENKTSIIKYHYQGKLRLKSYYYTSIRRLNILSRIV